MGRLGQQAEVAHLEAHIPSLLTVFGLNDDGVQQAFTTHLLDHRALDLTDFLAEDLTKTLSVLHQVLFLDDFKGGDAYAGSDRVASEGRTVLTRFDVQHDVIVGQHAGDWHHTTTESLTQDEDIGAHTFVVASQHLTRTGDTALHLVGHEQHVVLLTNIVAFLQVAIVRDINTSFTLNGLQQETSDFLTLLGQHLLQSIGVIVRDADETGSHRAIVGIRLWVITHGDDGNRAAMEVAFAANDLYLIVRDTFLDNTPTAGQLQACLVSFGARVHGQHLVVAKVFGNIFFPYAESVVIESAAAEGEAFGLVGHGLDDLGVAMALVDSRISRQEVKVFFSFDIPNLGALTFGEDDRQRMVVMGTVLGFQVHSLLR